MKREVALFALVLWTSIGTVESANKRKLPQGVRESRTKRDTKSYHARITVNSNHIHLAQQSIAAGFGHIGLDAIKQLRWHYFMFLLTQLSSNIAQTMITGSEPLFLDCVVFLRNLYRKSSDLETPM